jgi:hypothetical protein
LTTAATLTISFSMTRLLTNQTTYNNEWLSSNNNNDGFIVTNCNDAQNGTENLQLGTYPDEKLLEASTTTESTICIISVVNNGNMNQSDNNQS